jgi:hypothetical protein
MQNQPRISIRTKRRRFYHNLEVFHETKEKSPILSPGMKKNSVEGKHCLLPMSYNLFWKSIRRSKGRGLRLTHLRHPHPCDMCATLPAFEQELHAARKKLPTITDSLEREALNKHIRVLDGKVKRRVPRVHNKRDRCTDCHTIWKMNVQ